MRGPQPQRDSSGLRMETRSRAGSAMFDPVSLVPSDLVISPQGKQTNEQKTTAFLMIHGSQADGRLGEGTARRRGAPGGLRVGPRKLT